MWKTSSFYWLWWKICWSKCMYLLTQETFENGDKVMFIASKTCECLHHGESPFNQSTEAIQMSLANTLKISIKIANSLNISIKIAVLDMQAKVIHSDTNPDNFLPDHYNENIEGRIKKINEQSNWLQEKFFDMTSQMRTNIFCQ